jgi:hypothetical protein
MIGADRSVSVMVAGQAVLKLPAAGFARDLRSATFSRNKRDTAIGRHMGAKSDR